MFGGQTDSRQQTVVKPQSSIVNCWKPRCQLNFYQYERQTQQGDRPYSCEKA
ncbi:MAG: hypothetical protein HC849_13590 [Oscillatoriales cyanobacterium RU_3_3]|nr:hypothetical protein [Microcoleus sp. SU_5_6]NJL68010.1 hypothetical protein [Microcoleus sp. SM1_3_4]NJM61007.1 hypothetical protein [Oscillatoriales cyanobacterium RU_3_3]NJR26074.1 hypothetical protein [Richelia sp. CSU_2_1]